MRLLFCLILLAANAFAADTMIVLTAADAQQIKAAIANKSPGVRAFAELVRRRADAALSKGPWSVTFHRPKNDPWGVHEYYSEAPYFWPDPKNPAKMIRKDGERNPNRFDDNHRDIGVMSNAVLDLGAAAYFLGDEKYARKAAEDLRVWFEDPATRMRPALDHAQAVLGANDGRPTGIIDARGLVQCALGAQFLQASGKWEGPHSAAVRKWYADYLNWLMETKNGVAEGNSGNNHATWYMEQVAGFASYLGDKVALQYAYKRFNEDLLKQITASGSAPREEERTNSLSYTTFNLDAFALLSRIAQVNGTDLWHAAPLVKALHYAAPFVAHPETWKHQQISKFKADGLLFPGLAGAALKDKELLALHDSLQPGDDVWNGLLHLLVERER